MSKITDFCIAECKRQNDLTTEAVAGMVEAWYDAILTIDNVNVREVFDADNIKRLAKFVKPQNTDYRRTPVVFQNGERGLSWAQIPGAMSNLLYSYDELTADEFYIEFERIHPFEDGNGRVGAILWNILNENYFENTPVCPPDFFGQ